MKPKLLNLVVLCDNVYKLTTAVFAISHHRLRIGKLQSLPSKRESTEIKQQKK